MDRDVFVSMAPDADIDEFLALSRELGLKVVSVSPRHQTLEEVFLEQAKQGGSP